MRGRRKATRKGCHLPGAVLMSDLQEKSSPAFLWELQSPMRALKRKLREAGKLWGAGSRISSLRKETNSHQRKLSSWSPGKETCVEGTTNTEPGLRCLQCEPSKPQTKFFSGSLWNLESITGMQGRPPQNITEGRIDYLELELVEPIHSSITTTVWWLWEPVGYKGTKW